MKTKIFLLSLFISVTSFAQLGDITNILTFRMADHHTQGEALTVPSGKTWSIQSSSEGSKAYFNIGDGYWPSYPLDKSSNAGPFYFTSGMKIYFSSDLTNTIIQVWEYDAPSASLAVNDTQKDEKDIIVYPNPTNSKLAINTDKIYKVKVYDMSGRKLFETKSDSIDFSKLVNGIYVVKLFDVAEQEVSTYKVVKN